MEIVHRCSYVFSDYRPTRHIVLGFLTLNEAQFLNEMTIATQNQERNPKILERPKFHLAFVTSRLDTTRHVGRVEAVELWLFQHGGTTNKL